jgi:L-asparaginase
MRKRVHVLYAGGTIGMRPTESGYAPAPLADLIRDQPELRAPEMPELEITEHSPPMDSANARPPDWLRIARDIARRRGDFDAFVVLHGTDTMAYTASALAFLLRGLDRPVVVTGSQIPLAVLRSDGRQNMLTALCVAARDDVREVCLVFGSRILRGCRAVKASAGGFEAFRSPSVPPLGLAGVNIEIAAERLRPPARAAIALPDALDAAVGMLKVYPGLPAEVLRAATAPPVRGLVLEAYGAGNVPDRDGALQAALAEAAARDVVVVAVSQCLDGRVDLGAYAAGAPLVAAGAVGGLDMTSEAAYAKLVVLLSEGRPPAEVRALMRRDLCGELTG